MEADVPVLSPRQERFCRYAAFGHTLTEAARRAGYSPASARQRGSELYARQEIQDHVAVLASREARLEDSQRDSYMRQLREIRSACEHRHQYGTALRALTTEIRLAGIGSRRVGQHADKDEEQEAELRTRVEAELRPSIEAELRERIEAEAYQRARAELTAELAAEPVLSGTNHDHYAEPDTPAPAPVPAPASDTSEARAEPVLSGTFHDLSAELDDIDRLIADINGTPPLRSAKAAPTMTNHDIPGLVHRWRAAAAGGGS